MVPRRMSRSECGIIDEEVDQKQLQKDRVAKARHTITQDRIRQLVSEVPLCPGIGNPRADVACLPQLQSTARQSRSQSRRVSTSGGERLQLGCVAFILFQILFRSPVAEGVRICTGLFRVSARFEEPSDSSLSRVCSCCQVSKRECHPRSSPMSLSSALGWSSSSAPSP